MSAFHVNTQPSALVTRESPALLAIFVIFIMALFFCWVRSMWSSSLFCIDFIFAAAAISLSDDDISRIDVVNTGLATAGSSDDRLASSTKSVLDDITPATHFQTTHRQID